MTYEIHESFVTRGRRGYAATCDTGGEFRRGVAYDVTPEGCARTVRRRIAAGALPPGDIVFV